MKTFNDRIKNTSWENVLSKTTLLGSTMDSFTYLQHCMKAVFQ